MTREQLIETMRTAAEKVYNTQFFNIEIEAALTAIEAAGWQSRAEVLEEAAAFHDAEVVKLDGQIERNNEYMRRSRDFDSTANDYCNHRKTVHRGSAAAIRAMIAARPSAATLKEIDT